MRLISTSLLKCWRQRSMLRHRQTQQQEEDQLTGMPARSWGPSLLMCGLWLLLLQLGQLTFGCLKGPLRWVLHVFLGFGCISSLFFGMQAVAARSHAFQVSKTTPGIRVLKIRYNQGTGSSSLNHTCFGRQCRKAVIRVQAYGGGGGLPRLYLLLTQPNASG